MPPLTFIHGTRLGPYEILAPLGVGGMGEVYRARDGRLERDVAIKVLPATVAADPERRARFQREARVLATLNHPNIASIYGVEEADGVWALVLELVEGDTLAARVDRGPLPVAEVVRIARQLVDALDAAHERGIVHRDLKPANIKMTADQDVKILDFGLAKAIADPAESSDPTLSPTVTSGGTRDGVILGTAAYMSPEQARGRPVDKRADIWAFGCVLFELLAGRRPFGGESTSDVLVAVLEREPLWSNLPPGTPAGLQDVIRRCLVKDPKLRLRDIADARRDLDEARLARTGTSGSGSAVHASLPGRILRMLVPAAVGVAATLIAVALWGGHKAASPPSFERVTRIVATSANEFAPAISPDGKWIAYLSDARGPTDVWVKFIAGGDPANLTASLDLNVQSLDPIGGLQISPDGSLIAFAAAPPGTSNSIARSFASWVMPAPQGGTPRRILDAGNQGLAWSPDGLHIVYVRTGGSAGDALWVADRDGQHAREILRARGGLHTHWPHWSQDGRSVYFSNGPQNNFHTEIFRVAASGGPPEPVVRSSRRAAYAWPDAEGHGLFYAASPDTVDLGLWWRDLSTGRDYRVINGVGEYAAPSVSADGSRLAAAVITARQYLAQVNLDASTTPALAPLTDPSSGDLDPVWSPDGTRIAFSSLRSGNSNIWIARPDLTSATPIASDTAIDERPVYSPDGREIAFVSDRGGRRGVWLVNADGGAPRPLTATEVVGNLSWSRDGTRLVAAAPAGETIGLVTISRSDGTVRPLPVKGAATSPVWSPREDVIAYLETQVGGGTVVRLVDPSGNPKPFPQPDTPTWFSNGFVAWSPDGRRLAGVSLPGTTAGSIFVIDPSAAAPYKKILDLPATTLLRGLAWTPDGSALTVGVVTRSGDIVLAERAR